LNRKYINIDTVNERIKVRSTIKSCNWGKRSAGVNAIQPKNTAFKTPNMARTFKRSGFSPLISPGIAMKYVANEILAVKRAMKKRIAETVFGLPKDSVLPRSLKKFK
jgi:hypothetical protein